MSRFDKNGGGEAMITWDKAHAAVGAMIGTALLVLVVLLATGCNTSLPHRQQWELYSIQGIYSQLDCPGQHVETVDVDGQSFFLGCYGDTK